ncbi:MAG: hypothetical protein GTN76_00660 [Candidatus Aenigmarchaeota archaeon]|nr:hypothetical protein [Candidatus Aenigmarchaeota archaeon]
MNGIDERKLYEEGIEIERVSSQKLQDKSGQGTPFAYTEIYEDGGQKIYLPHDVKNVLPVTLWKYLKTKVKNVAGKVENYLVRHERLHKHSTDELLTESRTIEGTRDPGEKEVIKGVHAYGLLIGDGISKKVANVYKGIKEEAEKLKKYLESFGYSNLQPAEVRV